MLTFLLTGGFFWGKIISFLYFCQAPEPTLYIFLYITFFISFSKWNPDIEIPRSRNEIGPTEELNFKTKGFFSEGIRKMDIKKVDLVLKHILAASGRRILGTGKWDKSSY